MRPNGRICDSATRDRASIRRSFPTTNPASRHTLMWAPTFPLLALRAGPLRPRSARPSAAVRGVPAALCFRCDACGAAGVDADFAGGQGAGEIELVGGHEDGAAFAGRRGDDLVQHLATVRVEPGVRLVEQEELRVPHQRRAEREPAALAGRELAVGQVGHRGEVEPFDDRVRVGAGAAGRLGDEAQVLAHGQVVVAEGLVADERQVAARGAPVHVEIGAEHLALARVQRDEPRDQAEQRGLAGAVRAGEEHDLARVDVQVDTGQGREASEEAHGGAESDDERHASLRGPGWGATSADECTDRLRRRSNPARACTDSPVVPA